MFYEAIQKFQAHVPPQPEEFFEISAEEYRMLIRRIGDSQNVESTCLQYLWPSDKLYSVDPGLFLRCSLDFTELCRALWTNRTMLTLQIQVSGKAPDVLALSQAFDTDVSSPSQSLTIDPAEKQMMEVAIAMKVAIKEIAFLLCHNKALQTIQIQSDNNSDQDWVKLVRPLTKDLDVQQANVDRTKLNLTVQGGRTSTLICALIFHELLQSSTLRELTVETLDHYGDLLEGTPSYELIRASVRSLIANAKGPQADVHTLTKLKLADEGFQNQVVLVQPLTLDSNCGHTKLNVKFCGSGMSAAVYNLLFHVVLQSSTLKELTLETSDDYGDVLEGSPISALLQALVRPLVADEGGQQANVTLTKINLAKCQSISCNAC